jgi:hypothetical protein
MAIVKIVNAEGGSDARYDVSQMTPEERSQFDSEGRPLGADNPDQWVWTPGLPGARGGSSEYDMGGPGGGGGFSDAYVNQLRSLLQAQSTADLSNTRSAIQKALIGFGLTPEGFEDKLGALDEVTKSLIAQNTESGISYYARLMEQKKDALRSLVGRLNASGLSRSGAKGARMRRGQLDFDRLFQDSLSELLGQVGQLQSGYANNEQQRQIQLMQAMQNAANFWSGAGRSVAPAAAAPQASGEKLPRFSMTYNPTPSTYYNAQTGQTIGAQRRDSQGRAFGGGFSEY